MESMISKVIGNDQNSSISFYSIKKYYANHIYFASVANQISLLILKMVPRLPLGRSGK